jgi:hypothetical protein
MIATAAETATETAATAEVIELVQCGVCGGAEAAEEMTTPYNAETDSEGEPYCRACNGYRPGFGYGA